MKGTILKRDNGKLAIECLSFHYAKPEMTRHVWEIDSYTFTGLWRGNEGHAIGREATISDGRVNVYLGNGAYLEGRLKDGGQTHAVVVETIPVPSPKVRKDVETRWRDGRWQKYMKRGGWIDA